MAGSPKSVNTDTPIDSNYLQYLNSLSSGGIVTIPPSVMCSARIVKSGA